MHFESHIPGTRGRVPPRLEEGAKTQRLQIVAPQSWIERVEEWRRRQPRIPNMSQAIRELVDKALDAE